MEKLAVLVVHGMGDQKADFSDGMIKFSTSISALILFITRFIPSFGRQAGNNNSQYLFLWTASGIREVLQ